MLAQWNSRIFSVSYETNAVTHLCVLSHNSCCLKCASTQMKLHHKCNITAEYYQRKLYHMHHSFIKMDHSHVPYIYLFGM